MTPSSEKEPASFGSLWKLAVEVCAKGAWLWTVGESQIRLSAHAARLLGFAPDADWVPLEQLESRVRSESATWLDEVAMMAAEGSGQFCVERPLVGKAKPRVWLELKGGVVERDSAGQPRVLAGLLSECSVEHELREKLADRERQFRLMFEHMLTGFCLHEVIFDDDGEPVDYRYLEANAAFERHSGTSRDKLIGHTAKEVMPDLDPSLLDRYIGVGIMGEPIQTSYHAKALDRHLEVTVYSPRPGQFATLLEDVTQRVRAEAALRESEERFRELAEHIDGVIWLQNKDEMLYVSPAYEAVFGQSVGALYRNPRSFLEVVHEDDREHVARSRLLDFEDGAGADEEFRVIGERGETRWVRSRSFAIRDASGEIVRRAGISVDITSSKDQEARLREANRQLELLASTDALTGLLNRRHWFELLEREVVRSTRYPSPLSVMILDLDHFKRINDSMGHPAGDAVLIAVSKAVAAGVRGCDFVGRYGGEELVVGLPHTPLDGALIVAERLRRSIEQLHVLDGRIKVTASIGVASLPGAEPSAILAAADQALYRAKAAGRNCVIIWEGDAPQV
jgi:diguanylate cyclase (GGDEF)-like protein/PAS domain S-box-containing protein